MLEKEILKSLGIKNINLGVNVGYPFGETIHSINPTTSQKIASVIEANEQNYKEIIETAQESFKTWRMTPAPKRGEIVRQLGDELRKYKKELGALVSMEMGKIIAEGEGEVQEMIDICDYAVGLSRQIGGKIMPSERELHKLEERWHPLGIIGIISAFNFPVAVWAWNAAIAAVCGNTVIWKPSSQTPLCAIAVQKICDRVMKNNNINGVFNLLIGNGSTIGEKLISDRRISLISATGSCKMGHHVSEVLGKRLGRAPILELGGNNAVIVMDDANLDLAIPAILFGAVGTAGQRCTTTRRVLMQKGIAKKLTERLLKAYRQVKIGNPLDSSTLMGPLINQNAIDAMMKAVQKIKEEGGNILCGGSYMDRPGFFVRPAIVKARQNMMIIKEETFAPILYLIEIENLDEAIEVNNNVRQGLSSSIFTNDIKKAEQFLSAVGSDCGIANVNIGTSGAEIGGAFGGEKDTGGGREAGSDSWKAYMRRQTCTTNWSFKLPLAQGIKFE